MGQQEFYRYLMRTGVPVSARTNRRNRRERHRDDIIYRGPMAIPERIAQIVVEHPALKRTTHRHVVARYAEPGCVWMFRSGIPPHRAMVGEIVRLADGSFRVHAWSEADPLRYTRMDEPASIVAAKGDCWPVAELDPETFPEPIHVPCIPAPEEHETRGNNGRPILPLLPPICGGAPEEQRGNNGTDD